MILRRVIEHVEKQEWTAIWIDLVIVVVGVFIGIQVSNWNEGRATNRRAAVFTEQLTADLREEAWGSQLLVEYNGDVLANAERTAEALSGKTALKEVQRALASRCGDRPLAIGDYAGLADSLDYACTTGLPEATIAAAATTLRSDSTLVPLLRLRIADLETRLVDFTVNNKDIMDGLQAIAAGKP